MYRQEARLLRILVVDDSAADVRLIQHALTEENLPHSLVAMSTAESALEYLYAQGPHQASSLPDLIVVDINLPKISGFDLLGRLKNDQRFSAIPVVMMSSSSSVDDVNRAYQMGANVYVPKASSLDGLLRSMHHLAEFWFKTALLPDASHLAVQTSKEFNDASFGRRSRRTHQETSGTDPQ